MSSVNEQIIRLWNLVHNNHQYFEKSHFLIIGETRMIRIHEEFLNEDVGYNSAVRQMARNRGGILEVFMKLEGILNELLLARTIGIFERDHQLEKND